jgi:hypothetical protein
MAASHAGFFRYCSECHSGSERAPPNFLLGDADEVEAKLRHCAPRIYFRLSMWQRSADARAKTPMPPDTAVQRFKFTPAAWRDGGALSGLISSANERLRAEAGAAQGDALLRQSYREPARVPAGRARGDVAGTAGTGREARASRGNESGAVTPQVPVHGVGPGDSRARARLAGAFRPR